MWQTPLLFFFFIWPSGTLCDLSNKPRKTRVQYVCYTHGKHEVYSFKETSTCEYEIIILTPLLCEHPQFKTKEVGENVIDCLPVGDSPRKPRSLLKAEVDSLRFHQQTIRLSNNVSIAYLHAWHSLFYGKGRSEIYDAFYGFVTYNIEFKHLDFFCSWLRLNILV